MIVTAISVARRGGENDPDATMVIEMCDENGQWYKIGTERLSSCFSTCWHMPSTPEEAAERYEVIEVDE